MTTERKEQILKSGKFSSVTQHEAVEWINELAEDLPGDLIYISQLGCVNIDCSECSVHRIGSLGECKFFIIKKLTKIHNLSGLNNGIKFGI